VSVELVRRLLASGVVLPSEAQKALFHHLSTGTPLLRALVDAGGVSESALDDELRRSALPSLDRVVPLPALVDELPADLCRNLLSVPVRRDPRTGLVDVAVADPYDPHIEEEFCRHLGTDVRLLRASLAAIEQALARMARGEYSSTVILRRSVQPARPSSGPPIPLVRRASRQVGAHDRGQAGAHDNAQADQVDIETLGVNDIVEPTESDGAITDDLGQPMPLAAAKLPNSELPRAPALPTFGHQHPAPGASQEPFSRRSPMAPFASIDGVLEALGRAATRDEVIANLIVGMSTVAGRVGAFAVKKRGFCGIACNHDLGDKAAFRAIEIAGDAPTVLGIAKAKGSYLGPMPATPAHEPLLRLMKDTSGEVAAVLVSVAGRPAVILFAESLGDTMIATRRVEELARQASLALSRILTEAKVGRRGTA